MTHEETYQEEYLIKRNGEPVKCINLSRKAIQHFMTRLGQRFPSEDWSVSARFPLYGSD